MAVQLCSSFSVSFFICSLVKFLVNFCIGQHIRWPHGLLVSCVIGQSFVDCFCGLHWGQFVGHSVG